MCKIKLQGYQMIYPELDKQFYEKESKAYHSALMLIRANELVRNGMKMKRVNMPDAEGTKVTFTTVKDSEEFMVEIRKINNGFDEDGMKRLLELKEADSDMFLYDNREIEDKI